MPNDHRSPTPASRLGTILTRTDRLTVDHDGVLKIEGCSAARLLEEYGSPLYVISEATLRANFRRIATAFSSSWPAEVTVLYAIKANNNLAVRAVMHQEGAGGDCFGEGELHATFAGGADPAKVVLNGSNKSADLIRKAVAMGVTINIDAEDELDVITSCASGLGTTARVALRLKVFTEAYNDIATDYFGGDRLADYVWRAKWGFSMDAAGPLISRVLASPRMELLGYHFHVGRTSADVRFALAWAEALAAVVIALYRQTGFVPKVLDVGGGWPRERDPESRSLELNPTPVEEYASVVCSTLRRALAAAGLAIPRLWLEPGRFIAGNAAVLLATVGAIKRDLGLIWVNLDASTNNLMRIDTSHSAHHVYPATGMHREATERVIVVGETCIDSVFSPDCPMPPLERGEPVAILDAGMYAETASTQLNGIPRPATVLVNGSSSDIVKARESVDDVFARHRIPDRLR